MNNCLMSLYGDNNNIYGVLFKSPLINNYNNTIIMDINSFSPPVKKLFNFGDIYNVTIFLSHNNIIEKFSTMNNTNKFKNIRI